MTADEYFEGLSLSRKSQLNEIRHLIKSHAAGIQESMAYNLPAYFVGGEQVFSLASQKHYMSFYACYYDLLENKKDLLSAYDCGKSCVRFKEVNAKVLSDLEELIDYILNHAQKSKYKKKA